jgi:methionyl-tRNA formyltransferase
MTLRVAFAGTPEFALSAFNALVGSPHTVVGVLTQPDRPKGRGRQLAASPVKLAALAHAVPVSQPVSLKNESDRADLVSWKPDVLVVVAYGLILPRAVLDLPRFGCVNIHASLLPRWRGAAPVQRAILAGDKESGVSIMRMEAGLDTGPVYLERRVAIGAQETGGSLHDRLADLGGPALLEVLGELERNRALSTPQSEDGITYAAKIDKSEALVDWHGTAVEVDRKVRAFNPWPVAETRLDGEQLRIHQSRVIDEDRRRSNTGGPESGHDRGGSACEPGTIVDVTGSAIVVACGRGFLGLTEVQRPGRRLVAARDLINTLDLAGRRLG